MLSMPTMNSSLNVSISPGQMNIHKTQIKNRKTKQSRKIEDEKKKLPAGCV